jgi:hypothetical protein
MAIQLSAVIGIIVFSGLIGGLAAYLASESITEREGRSPLARYLILGVIASAAVPLFLSLVRSQVTQDMLKAVEPGKAEYSGLVESYLIFVGICLIAAFSARRFIDGISKQVLQRLDQVEVVTADTKEALREVAKEVEGADSETAPLPAGVRELTDAEEEGGHAHVPVSADELRALEALSRRTYRTRTGIAEDASISRNRISEILDALYQKKMALPTTSPNTGGQRWTITKRGEAALHD